MAIQAKIIKRWLQFENGFLFYISILTYVIPHHSINKSVSLINLLQTSTLNCIRVK